MPSQTNTPELVQPWRAWYTELRDSNKRGEPMGKSDNVDAGPVPSKFVMSNHGTIALDPRDDVDLFKEKVKPVRSA